MHNSTLQMRKFKADWVYPVSSSPIKNGIVVTSEQGSILDVLHDEHVEYTAALENSETVEGVICPGFVNTHCHIELSYLRNHLQMHSGLNGFISELQKTRTNFPADVIEVEIEKALQEMHQNGIVAVADICNGNSTLSAKTNSSLYIHSFIELFGFDVLKATSIFEKGLELYAQFKQAGLSTSITPHAPYSTSFKLMQLILAHCKLSKQAISIHNQESDEENELYLSKRGKLAELLRYFGNDLSQWNSSATRSLPGYFEYIKSDNPTLLVHNTYSSASDIQHVAAKNVFFCCCPNANIFIENRLPDLTVLMSENVQLTLGTDSLASNHQLCIWEEIKTIHRKFPDISLHDLLNWATLNGARFMRIDEKFGSLEKGKTPGIVALPGGSNFTGSAKRLI